MRFERFADMRYVGQEYFVTIPVDKLDFEAISKTFHDAYQSQYGHSTPGAPIEFVNLRLSAMGHIDKQAHSFEAKLGENPVKTSREIVFDGERLETRVLERDLMPVGELFKGPLVIDEHSATTVVPPAYTVEIEPSGHMLIRAEA